MATCKECFHNAACVDMLELMGYIVDGDGIDADKRCKQFIHTSYVAPIVHGMWVKSVDNGCEMHMCSICGARVVKEMYEYENPNRYCYYCGARMDGEELNSYDCQNPIET